MKSRTKIPKFNKLSVSQLGRIMVVTGARQTGKTTLVKQLFPEYPYLSIEDPVLRMQYKALTAAQWEALYPKAILDEVQKEPELIESIKAAYDQFSETRYILLGSSQLLLLQKYMPLCIKETFLYTKLSLLCKEKYHYFRNHLV